jgi:Flp pilus assembly protein CpaB
VRRGLATRTPAARQLAVAAVVAVACAAAGVFAWRSGLLQPAIASGPPPGSVAVPVLALPLPAYTQVQLEHLIDPSTRELAVVYLPEGSLLDETLRDPAPILGRVLARAKSAGRVFSEADFLPLGTRPGLVAGVPPGMRAMRLEAERVLGVAELRQGDALDLVATAASASGAAAPLGAPAGRVRTVAHDAVIVEPVAARPRARGAIEEVVIAVAAHEVALVAEAIAVGSRLDAIPHSGRPGGEPEGPAHVAAGVHYVDEIAGGRRTTVAVPGEAPARAADGARLR